MLTYLATYRLRPALAEPTAALASAAPSVTVRILDASLAHAAARAGWRLPLVAAAQGWHPGATELVAVELVAEDAPAAVAAPLVDPDPGKLERTWGIAREVTPCEVEAGRLVAAALVVAASAAGRR